MHRSRLLAAIAVAIAALLAVGVGATFATTTNVVGHVYVNNNTTINAISGFDRHADGSLTPIAGSPFAAGGAGFGTPTGSAGGLQLSADGRYLLAVNAGSNQLSVLKIRANGALRRVDLVSSRGTTPLSIAIHGSLVYVANAGAGGSNYTGFRLSPDGQLIAIPRSTVRLPDAAHPGQVLFSPNGRHLVGTRVGPDAGPSFIDSFSVRASGRLVAALGSPFAAQGVGPFGSEFRPTNSNQLFVSNAHNGAGNGTVSSYHVASDSSLTAVAGSPFADNETAPCWVEISHDGAYLFAINTGSSSISRYSIAAGGGLTLLGSTAFKSPTGLRPFDARLDPSGTFLYVVDASGKISVFAVDGGSLAERSGSPFSIPGSAAPFGIVVN